jgi:formylglycine-generating enzyme required for sulfatase activity
MKGANPKDSLKRTSSRPGRAGSRDRKQRSSEKFAVPDSEQAERVAELVAPADEFVAEEDVDAIFASEPPQISPSIPVEPIPELPEPPPPKQGMGRWFLGVALCLVGTAYIGYQLVSGRARPIDDLSPAVDTQEPKPPQTVAKVETIYKLPQPSVEVSPQTGPVPSPKVSIELSSPPEVAKTAIPEPPVLPESAVSHPPPEVEQTAMPEPPAIPESAVSQPPPEVEQTAMPEPPTIPGSAVSHPPPQVSEPPIPKPPLPEPVAVAPALPDASAEATVATRTAAVSPDERAGENQSAAPVVGPGPNPAVIRDCEQCPELVLIPAGTFVMGSPADEPGHHPHEAPQHEVSIAAPFAIGRFEVTFAEWDMCVKEGGCRHAPQDEGWGRERMPAINVAWRDIAEQFLPWLASKSGKAYRLPSEAEWEYVVRVGAEGEAAHAGANALCGYANTADEPGQVSGPGATAIGCRDGFANTAPVGSFKPNPWGIHDLAGNVWEWVADCWNETYGGAPADGSAWTTGDCSLRVVRGGSWSSAAAKLRAADRGWNRPDGRAPSIGFRVARKL